MGKKDALLEMIKEMVEEENKAEVGDSNAPRQMSTFASRRRQCLGVLESQYVPITSHRKETQVRTYWIPIKGPANHDNILPRLAENVKNEILQVGPSLTNSSSRSLYEGKSSERWNPL